ncbi:hypothetical protein K438DRAFT_1960371 [Mycena galopus ATCC 62051]|nr:hypothetical protein K438DRAFT_1960371 [Mycena galopus ATCC 62051]
MPFFPSASFSPRFHFHILAYLPTSALRLARSTPHVHDVPPPRSNLHYTAQLKAPMPALSLITNANARHVRVHAHATRFHTANDSACLALDSSVPDLDWLVPSTLTLLRTTHDALHRAQLALRR